MKSIDNARKGHWLECPDCCGNKQFERYCPECGGTGCRNCNLGMIFTKCPTCQGEGEIFVTIDTGLDVFEDYSTVDGMKMVSNYQMRREGI